MGFIKRSILLFSVIFLAVLIAYDASAYSTKGIIAYPVPFNPRKGVLTVNDLSGVTFNKVKIMIYDINGDKVFSSTNPGYPAIWNGRNDRGRVVKPGMYILIVEAENLLTGLYGKKVLRILIEY